MINRTIRTLTASAAAIAAFGFAGASTVSAKAGDVEVRGDCTARSDYKLKLQPRGGTIEYEYEVDSNVNGQRWSVRITDYGVAVFTGTRTTLAPSGSFTVSGRTTNRAGTDAFVARATNAATGEVCTARLSV